MTYTVAAFYHFFDFANFKEQRQPLVAEMTRLGIKGSLLISSEGFNSTVAGSREAIDEFLSYLRTHIVKGPFEHKESFAATNPFKRTKVRLKKETISLGEKFSMERTGEYVDAKDWNALISDPDVIVLDTRNTYETHLGTFEHAIDPKIKNFKELPTFIRHTLSNAKQKKIATFCTGGIRCEKFTPWMLEQGFEKVYHLKGGILKYLEEISPEESLWNGECYVFDQRIAVGHGLIPSDTASMCIACGHALIPEDRQSSAYVKDKSCPYCADKSR